jgi:hypothetical protein
MPLWFVAGTFGSWFLSIALVVFLVKRVFKNFDIEDETLEAETLESMTLESEGGDPL